jgi:outer membrane protein
MSTSGAGPVGQKFERPSGKFVVQFFAKERRMKKSGVLLLVTGFWMAWVSLAWGAEPLKIAYVDIQKALNLCEAGKAAKKQITLEVERMRKNFAGKQKELEKLKEDLEKRGLVLSEAAREEKARDYQAKTRDLQRMERDYQEELQRKDRELTESILRKLEGVVKKMGEDGKYTLILERNQGGIIYASDALDLTDELIKIFDQKGK